MSTIQRRISIATDRICCTSTSHILPCGRHRGESLQCQIAPCPISAYCPQPRCYVEHRKLRRSPQPIHAAQGFGTAEPAAKKPRKKAKADGGVLSKTPDKVSRCLTGRGQPQLPLRPYAEGDIALLMVPRWCRQVVKEAVREATGGAARPVDPREAAKGRLDQVLHHIMPFVKLRSIS